MASAAIPGHYVNNPPASPLLSEVSAFDPLPSRAGGVDDGSVPGFHPLETDIDAFPSVITFLRYRLTNSAVYIDTDAHLSPHKLKRKVELMHPTWEPFTGEDPWNLSYSSKPLRRPSTVSASEKV